MSGDLAVELEHVALQFTRRADLGHPLRMHVDVAGCAGAATAALGIDAIDAFGPGQFHDHVASVAVDGDHLVVKRLEIDGWHAKPKRKGRAFYFVVRRVGYSRSLCLPRSFAFVIAWPDRNW